MCAAGTDSLPTSTSHWLVDPPPSAAVAGHRLERRRRPLRPSNARPAARTPARRQSSEAELLVELLESLVLELLALLSLFALLSLDALLVDSDVPDDLELA